MHGGVKFYRGSAKAARSYVEADHSRADDYYLAEGSGVATRYVARADAVRVAGELSGDAYERWVAGHHVETGAAKGRLRDDANALRFVEVTINGPKTWSLAAALHPEISAALDAAQDRAAEQVIGWIAQHATTRVGPRGRQVQVPAEQIEAAVIRHYTSRAGDPHRHLHLQVNARVFAEGKWRGLHSVGIRDMIEAINGIGHAAMATDPEFRATLAVHGFTLEDQTGELVELQPYVGRFSARANQIRRNIDRYEAEWRTAHPDEEPGPRLREAWDRRAWAQARPDKVVPVDGAAIVAAWSQLLHDLGYRGPMQAGSPNQPTGPRIGALDRDSIAELVTSQLGAERSAWNAADIRGRVEKHLAAAGLVVDAAVRIGLAEDITARAVARCVPLLDAPGVPEHVRSLTSQHVLDVEADLVSSIVQRAQHPAASATLPAAHAGLDTGQREAVSVLAGSAQLVVVEGAAGAGKTTTLAAVQDQLASEGQRMVVVTPTLKAAQVAARETGIQASSAAGLAHEFGWRWDEAGHWRHEANSVTAAISADTAAAVLSRGDLLLVDEAGMLDQDTALALFQIADQTGARVAFVGDRHQLPAVGRGGVLDLAARWAHPGAVVGLDVVHRFTDPDYARISLAMRRGEHTAELFEELWDRGQIRLHTSDNERLHAIADEAAERIAAAPGRVGDVVVMADTVTQVGILNGIIRDQLVAHGLVDDTRAVTTDAGERIGVGDRVATRLNDHNLGVANRDQWRVTAIGTDGSLTLTPVGRNPTTGRAPVRDVPAWYVATRVELAYATTVYGAQAETTGTGHMLLAETTTGSAAYVGMTRGRENNIAHLVAKDVNEARVIWRGVMGRDRADLGPAHAAEKVAEEMERYAPQRPRQVVLDKLRRAWKRQADLTEQHDAGADLRRKIAEALTIRHQHAPRLAERQQAMTEASERRDEANHELKALETRLGMEQQGVLRGLWDQWRTDEPTFQHAKDVIDAGPGRLGLHRRQVRDAQSDLTDWARRWQPILSNLPEQPAEVLDHVDHMEQSQLLQVFTDTARDTVERAHPEAGDLRARAAWADEAATAAASTWRAQIGQMDTELRPYGHLARAGDLPERIAEIDQQLTELRADLDDAIAHVERLLHSPEIRSLPPGTLQTERDQWSADRITTQKAAERVLETRHFGPRSIQEMPGYRGPTPTDSGLSL